MSYQNKKLNVIWQDRDTRSCFHIGTLIHDETGYIFSYNHNSLSFKEAINHGYKPHPLFPNLDEVYKSINLFTAFDRRIPSKNRHDYIMILRDLGLDEAADKMDILKATRGKIANDTYSLEEPITKQESEIQTSFYIQGMRHQNNLHQFEKKINYDTPLILEKEPGNQHDSWAIAIYTQHGTKLGYVPRYYSKYICMLIDNDADVHVKITYINEKSNPHWWVKVDFCASILQCDQKILQEILI